MELTKNYNYIFKYCKYSFETCFIKINSYKLRIKIKINF